MSRPAGGTAHPVATRGILIIATLLAALMAAWALRLWWVSPNHRVSQFLSAVSHHDCPAALALADPPEVLRLRLTPDKLAGMAADAAGARGGVVLRFLGWQALREKQSQYNRWALVGVYQSSGAPLNNVAGQPMQIVVQACNTDTGWKISPSKFLYTLLCARTGMQGRMARYAALCARYNVAPEVYFCETGKWEQMSPSE